jgi:hypothetical protein
VVVLRLTLSRRGLGKSRPGQRERSDGWVGFGVGVRRHAFGRSPNILFGSCFEQILMEQILGSIRAPRIEAGSEVGVGFGHLGLNASDIALPRCS